MTIDKDPIIPISASEERTILSCDPHKYVFWCGAGISAEKPTNLPLGKEFSNYVLAQLIDDQFPIQLSEKLNGIDEILKKHNASVGDFLRLESVISEVALLEDNVKPSYTDELSFINSLSIFSESPINLYHYLLANLVIKGSNVVTTNYDLGIEKALDCLCPKEYSFVRISEGQYVYSSSNSQRGKVYHIHGIALEPKEIGITYRSVSRTFNEEIMEQLHFWTKNNYIFAFLGYSCGDNYDVERVFQKLSSRSSVNAISIYVQRRAKDLSTSVIRHLSCFSKAYVTSEGIVTFLTSLFSELDSIRIPYENDCFYWKDRINKQIKISEQMRGVLFFRICKLAGINPREFTYYSNGKSGLYNMMNTIPSHMEDHIIRLTQFHVLKEMGDAGACRELIEESGREYNIKYNNTFFYPNRIQYDMNEVLVVKRDFTALQSKLPSIRSISDGIHDYHRENKMIGWEFSTPLHQHAMIIVNEAKKYYSRGLNTLPTELVHRAVELLNCNDILVNSDLSSFEEINQYCVALRNRALMLTLIYGEEKIHEISKCFVEYIELYVKESSIQGISISLHEYSSIQYFLHIQTNKSDYLAYSNNLLKDVLALQGFLKNGRFENELCFENSWRKGYENNR